ncbi:MAG: hypothetical protein Q9M89_06890 [Persephonella sp.]|nr:hypothetical protein [Persephonella sp.]
MLPGAVSSSVKLALKRFENILKPKIVRIEDLSHLDTVFLADTNNYQLVNTKLGKLINENTQIVIYDHHPVRKKIPKYVIKKIKKTGVQPNNNSYWLRDKRKSWKLAL